MASSIRNTSPTRPKLYLQTVFHFLTFVFYASAWKFQYDTIWSWVDRRWFWYETEWCFLLQVLLHGVELFKDLKDLATGEHSESPVLDYAWTTAAFPISCQVSLSFWALYHYDPDHALPHSSSKLYPCWLNHTQHTLVLFSALFQLIFVRRHKYPTNGFLVTFSLMLFFTFYVHYLVLIVGADLYPFLKNFSLLEFALFHVLVVSTLAASYWLGRVVTESAWSEHESLDSIGVIKCGKSN